MPGSSLGGRGRFVNHAARVFLGTQLSSEALESARESTLVSVRNPSRAYSSFGWRLVLSAVIATGGIAVSSSAVVIGAMLIAPLMSPMLGTTLAVALGDARAALRTFFITVAGALACVLVAIAVAAVIPVGIDTNANAEVLARVSPRLADLVVALASGLMASVAVMRDDIPDALPGVAIAAAIVPPLCVVGCSVYEGDFASAAGASLLFLANYFAIQISGFLLFLAIGVRSQRDCAHDRETRRARMAWIVSVALGTVLVSIPLSIASLDMVQRNSEEVKARSIASEWLEGSGYRIASINVEGSRVDMQIAGSGSKPSVEELNMLLDEAGAKGLTLRVMVLDEVVLKGD